MEKSFSIAVEMESGEKRTLTVAGSSSGSVFQQVKAMPGVRRVGRVAEVGANGYVAPPQTSSAGREQKADDRRQQSPAAPAAAATTGTFAGTGPRVVLSSRQKTGEQPFKNLYVPPERLAVFKPAPPPPPKPIVRAPVAAPAPVVVAAAPKPVESPAEQEQTAPSTGSLETASLEYRIVKSRRQNGDPYLLQRGTWGELKGKRAFSINWEKGFPDREKAEAHQRWMAQMAAEMAEMAELDEQVEEVEEVEEVGA